MQSTVALCRGTLLEVRAALYAGVEPEWYAAIVHNVRGFGFIDAHVFVPSSNRPLAFIENISSENWRLAQ